MIDGGEGRTRVGRQSTADYTVTPQMMETAIALTSLEPGVSLNLLVFKKKSVYLRRVLTYGQCAAHMVNAYIT